MKNFLKFDNSTLFSFPTQLVRYFGQSSRTNIFTSCFGVRFEITKIYRIGIGLPLFLSFALTLINAQNNNDFPHKTKATPTANPVGNSLKDDNDYHISYNPIIITEFEDYKTKHNECTIFNFKNAKIISIENDFETYKQVLGMVKGLDYFNYHPIIKQPINNIHGAFHNYKKHELIAWKYIQNIIWVCINASSFTKLICLKSILQIVRSKNKLILQTYQNKSISNFSNLNKKNTVYSQNINKSLGQNLRTKEISKYIRTSENLIMLETDYLPNFFQTFLALVFLIFSIPIFIFLAIKWHNNSLLRQKNELEGYITEKNKFLINNNLELKEKIKQNEMLHSIMVHDIKGPIFFIGSISNEILLGWERLTKDDIKQNLDIIRQASQSINSFVVDFLTWSKHYNSSDKIEKERFNVSNLMTELIEFYNNSDKIKRGRLSLTIDCPEDLVINSNKHLLKIVIGNLLSNSIKFSSDGIITLYANKSKNKRIVIGCKDQGKGMAPSVVQLLTENNYRGNSINNESFKMGYVFINDIIKILNSKIQINSKIGVGTDVSIEIKQ